MPKRNKPGSDVVLKFSEHKRKRVDELESDLDALFQLPLTEFTGERNALAARLKKSGRGDDAARVKALAKPSISAWAVNQLYWNHRSAFDQLIASGERVHKAQKSGKLAEMREAIDERRAELTQLPDLATSLLRDAGQNPSLDTVRRTTTTLEAMSAMSATPDWGSPSDAPRSGRLTHDVDPPGFESFASFVPGMRSVRPAAAGGTDLKTTSARRKVTSHEETRKAKIAAAKATLQDAKRSVSKAQARVQSLEAAKKKADAESNKAEKHRRDVEASLEKAKAASEAALRRARSVAVDLEEAASAVDDAEHEVEKASKELESLSGD